MENICGHHNSTNFCSFVFYFMQARSRSILICCDISFRFVRAISRIALRMSWAAPTWRYINQSTSHAWFTSIGRVTSPPLHLLLPLHSLGTTIHARQTGQDRQVPKRKPTDHGTHTDSHHAAPVPRSRSFLGSIDRS